MKRGALRGIIKKIDSQNRVIIPCEYLKSIGISNGDRVEIFLYENGIFIRKCDYKGDEK